MTKTLAAIPKWVKIVVLVVLTLFVIGFFVIGWVVSSRLMAINTQKIEYDQTITSISGNTYTFTGSAYDITGTVGGLNSHGTFVGIFNAPTAMDAATKTSSRILPGTVDPSLRVGDKLSLQGNIWTSNPLEALGLDYQDVTYKSPVGDMGAWLVPGTATNKWVVGIHGTGADKTEMLRFIQPVHDAGSTMLVINYRNDPGNPAAPDKRNHLGATEWEDVQAAVRYAKDHGATDITLYGDSLGGSLVQNYLKRSDDSKLINRVILDSPALDWHSIIRRQLEKNGYPKFLYSPTAVVLKLRAGISLKQLSTKPADIQHKTLIIHSADDLTVPQAPNKALAATRPDLVQFVDFKQGGHLRSWNNDQAKYTQLIKDFLTH